MGFLWLYNYGNIGNFIAHINQWFIILFGRIWSCCNITADMIKQLCEQMNISVSELARRIGQTPQNFNKKLKRETVTLDELKAIADALDIKFEQVFIFLIAME